MKHLIFIALLAILTSCSLPIGLFYEKNMGNHLPLFKVGDTVTFIKIERAHRRTTVIIIIDKVYFSKRGGVGYGCHSIDGEIILLMSERSLHKKTYKK